MTPNPEFQGYLTLLYSFSRNVHNIPAGNVEKDYFSLFLD
jgi:hypothetical protein